MKPSFGRSISHIPKVTLSYRSVDFDSIILFLGMFSTFINAFLPYDQVFVTLAAGQPSDRVEPQVVTTVNAHAIGLIYIGSRSTMDGAFPSQARVSAATAETV